MTSSDLKQERLYFCGSVSTFLQLVVALLNPMINEVSNEAYAILLLICSHEVWVKVTFDWFTACAYAYA